MKGFLNSIRKAAGIVGDSYKNFAENRREITGEVKAYSESQENLEKLQDKVDVKIKNYRSMFNSAPSDSAAIYKGFKGYLKKHDIRGAKQYTKSQLRKIIAQINDPKKSGYFQERLNNLK